MSITPISPKVMHLYIKKSLREQTCNKTPKSPVCRHFFESETFASQILISASHKMEKFPFDFLKFRWFKFRQRNQVI